jgi:5-hydroxyisourate hydrolase-like protein (transthyretin family)
MPQVIRSLSARPYLLCIAAFITTALLVGTNQSFSASSLKVISPNGGQSYAVGQSVNIKWAKGNGGSQVKVTLLKGGKGYLVIQKKTKNDGKLTWKVPSKVKAGSNYKIKIQSLSDTKVSDISNKPFKITKAKDTKTATFKVTKPNGGNTYKTGKKMAIRWVKGSGTYVKITLLKGKTTTTIHKKTKNDGKHTYTIPSTIKAGKTYKVKICSTKSTKSCATSKAFTIAKGTATTIKVTYPNGAEELEQGGTHVIKWNKGNGGKFVKIQLTRVKAGKDKGFRFIAKKTPNDGKFSWKIPTTNKYPVGSKYKIKIMAIGKASKKINDLSDKTFSIVKASSGGSTGGGNTGGGSTGGGSTGGHDGDATVDDPTGPPETDDGGDVEATLRITYPSPGQEFEVGEAFDIAYAATGAARDMEVCLKLIDPNDAPQYILNHGAVGRFAEVTVRGIRLDRRLHYELGVWRIRVSALFEGDSCSATVDNFGTESDNPRSEINFTIKAPEALCGNGIVEGDEVCDYAGLMCQGYGYQSDSFCVSGLAGEQVCARLFRGPDRNVVRCRNCVAQEVWLWTGDVLYYNRNDIPDRFGRLPTHKDFPNNRICPGFVP